MGLELDCWESANVCRLPGTPHFFALDVNSTSAPGKPKIWITKQDETKDKGTTLYQEWKAATAHNPASETQYYHLLF